MKNINNNLSINNDNLDLNIKDRTNKNNNIHLSDRNKLI
jgi:hypothetical protein